eukprot:TRINITY_DN5127_c0_g2_i1.p1 TRINITY_DN5127_c0_g2~~TRINITY_DN5127_c0_g2_i1.p1  ORF type:complete len:114 (+),score=8.30 TRINITY_DN5127_c0_g2_i1:177-518(+)
MNFADPSTCLLPGCGGDCVKLFDVSEDTGSDLCMLSYSRSPGFHVNSAKWNHTNTEQSERYLMEYLFLYQQVVVFLLLVQAAAECGGFTQAELGFPLVHQSSVGRVQACPGQI